MKAKVYKHRGLWVAYVPQPGATEQNCWGFWFNSTSWEEAFHFARNAVDYRSDLREWMR